MVGKVVFGESRVEVEKEGSWKSTGYDVPCNISLGRMPGFGPSLAKLLNW
jgi:hypothetical protein